MVGAARRGWWAEWQQQLGGWVCSGGSMDDELCTGGGGIWRRSLVSSSVMRTCEPPQADNMTGRADRSMWRLQWSLQDSSGCTHDGRVVKQH